jgi:hypothetical protein
MITASRLLLVICATNDPSTLTRGHRCTERRRVVVEFWLLLALALIVVGRLIRRAWTHLPLGRPPPPPPMTTY